MRTIAIVQKSKYVSHFFGLVALGFILVYILSTFAIVRQTAVRASTEAQLNKLSSVVGDLEFKYIGLKNDLKTGDLASQGFSETPTISYISRTTITALAIQSASRE